MLTLALIVAVVAAVRGMWSPCGLSMISSLNPVAERARGHRPTLTAAWYIAGAVLGGGLLGGCCALAAAGLAPLHLSAATAFGIAAACAAVAVGSDARTCGVSLPDHPRQVNERWLGSYRRWIYAAGFGAQIGTGFATYIMTAAVYLTAALAILSGPSGALIIGLSFGLARGLCIVVSVRAVTPEQLRSLLQRVEGLAVVSLSATVLVEIAVASVAAGMAGGVVPAAIVALALVVAALVPAVSRRRPMPLAP